MPGAPLKPINPKRLPVFRTGFASSVRIQDLAIFRLSNQQVCFGCCVGCHLFATTRGYGGLNQVGSPESRETDRRCE